MRLPSYATLVLCLVIGIAAACSRRPETAVSATPITQAAAQEPPPGQPPPGPPPFNPSGQTALAVAVGDIGECHSPAVPQTAELVRRNDGHLLLAGDLAYMNGSPSDFARCFDPAWGQFRHRWRPSPGNHEYGTPNAAGYFQYFGSAASPGGQPYYAFRAGDWHVLMLNSSLPVSIGSPQFEFVRDELRTNRNTCAMAVWHHPLFTSGPNGPNVFMRDMWGLLYEHGADVVVTAHDHLYERFAKQDVDGRADARGIRQFIAGTGGARLYDFHRTAPNSQHRVKAHGVLRLTLNPTGYAWSFVDVNGLVGDAGAESCH